MRPDPSECPHCRAAPAQRVACWHGTPRPAPARIVDVRLVLDREDRTRVYVDGRALLAFSSAAEALTTLGACIEHAPPGEQLQALRRNYVRAPAPDPERAEGGPMLLCESQVDDARGYDFEPFDVDGAAQASDGPARDA